MKTKTTSFIKNQVFLGCPWRTIRPKYEKVFEDFQKKYPLSFIIIGRDNNQEAGDLLNVIKSKLVKSSYAIFDATSGNANVSLEFGFAEASDIPHSLYVSDHKASKKTDTSIISDLAGKKRNIYKNERSLRYLLDKFAKEHNYTKQFESMLRKETRNLSKGEKKRYRTLCLKIVHQLDNNESIRRNDLTENILGGIQGYKTNEIDKALKALNRYKLLIVTVGRYSDVQIGQ